MKKEMRFSDKAQEKLKDILSKHGRINKESSILPALTLAQEEFGYISPDVEEYVAGLLELPVVKIHEVVTFYTMYNKKAVGKYHIQICSNVSCYISGSDNVTNHICKKLDI